MDDIRTPDAETAIEPIEVDSEAPYGRKADGTPKKRPGRPPKSATSSDVANVSVSPTEIPPAIPVPASPQKPKPAKTTKPTPREQALTEIQTESASTGWFSVEADRLRCERARFAARHWLDAARFAIATGEDIARGQVARKLYADGHTPESIEHTLKRVPYFRDVPMDYGGARTDCETVNAQALAFLAGYFLPATPDHPLAQAGIAVVSSFVAYKRAIEKAMRDER